MRRDTRWQLLTGDIPVLPSPYGSQYGNMLYWVAFAKLYGNGTASANAGNMLYFAVFGKLYSNRTVSPAVGTFNLSRPGRLFNYFAFR